jgi:hypothetical protein
MMREYQVWSGRRVVSTRRAPNAYEAAIDYVRALGCAQHEVRYLGPDTVSWRGATYRATAVIAEPPLSPTVG